MTRRWLWTALVVAGIAVLIALSTLHDVLVGCDHGPVGIGRPTCEAELGGRYVMLAISLAVLAASAIAAILLRAGSNRRRLTMSVRRSAAGTTDLALATALAALVSELVAGILRGPPLSWQMTDVTFLALFLVAVACVFSTLLFAYLWRRFATTPGLWIFGLTIRHAATGRSLSPRAAFARWILLFAPIALWVYPLVVGIVFDPGQFLILTEFPAWIYQIMLLPVAWYLLLGASVLLSEDARGWHDRVAGSSVVPSAG
jgi:hypothetical protein